MLIQAKPCVVTSLIAALSLTGCSRGPATKEPPPLVAVMAIRLPYPPPNPLPNAGAWGIPYFCLKDNQQGCLTPDAKKEDSRNTIVDPWCVDITAADRDPAFAGPVHLADETGKRRTFHALETRYELRSLPYGMDLRGPLTFTADGADTADGDGIPSFSLDIPEAPMPSGEVMVTGDASKSAGLPFDWRQVEPGTGLSLTLTKFPPNRVVVKCWYPAAQAPKRVSPKVIRWLADRGAENLTVALYITSYWKTARGEAEYVVDRAAEFDGARVQVVP